MKKLTKAECISRLSTCCDGTSVFVGKYVKMWIASVKYRNSFRHDVQILIFNDVKLSELSYLQLWHIVRKVGTSCPMKYCVVISRENGCIRFDWSTPLDLVAIARSYDCVELSVSSL